MLSLFFWGGGGKEREGKGEYGRKVLKLLHCCFSLKQDYVQSSLVPDERKITLVPDRVFMQLWV